MEPTVDLSQEPELLLEAARDEAVKGKMPCMAGSESLARGPSESRMALLVA